MSDVVAMASFFCDLAPQLGCWLAARQMHIVMLRAVMRAPLTFFDTTPIGRIISRFAKDVDVLDTSLPPQISDTIYCLFEVIFFLQPSAGKCSASEVSVSPRISPISLRGSWSSSTRAHHLHPPFPRTGRTPASAHLQILHVASFTQVQLSLVVSRCQKVTMMLVHCTECLYFFVCSCTI